MTQDPATQRAELADEEAETIQATVEAHAEKTDLHKHP